MLGLAMHYIFMDREGAQKRWETVTSRGVDIRSMPDFFGKATYSFM
jgi:hypothetical protein